MAKDLRVAVLGGGVAGVSIAMKLAARGGFAVDLYEREAALGGLQQSVRLQGLVFDVGAFVFGPDFELLNTFPALRQAFVKINPMLEKITPHEVMDHYPGSVQGTLASIGFFRATLILPDILISKFRYRNPQNLEAWISSIIGHRLYRDTGLENYVKKLYDRGASEIGLSFATQRLNYLQETSLLRMISSKFRKTTRSLSSPGASYVGRPPSGFQSVYDEIRTQLEKAGVALHLKAPITAVLVENGTKMVHSGGKEFGHDIIVSTVPVCDLFRLLGKMSSAEYEFMNLVSLFYQGHVHTAGNVIFIFSDKGRWKRLTSFSGLHGVTARKDHFTVEITTRPEASIDPLALHMDFESHATKLGIVSDLELLGSFVTRQAYPVFHAGAEAALQQDLATIEELGIHTFGRQGRFEYTSSQHVSRHAHALVERIAAERK